MATKNIVDTHALVWYLEGNPRLGPNAKSVLDEPTSELIVPSLHWQRRVGLLNTVSPASQQ